MDVINFKNEQFWEKLQYEAVKNRREKKDWEFPKYVRSFQQIVKNYRKVLKSVVEIFRSALAKQMSVFVTFLKNKIKLY